MRNTDIDLPPHRTRKLLLGGGISIADTDAIVEYVCRGTCGYLVHIPHAVPERGQQNRYSSQMVKKASVASKHRKYYSRLSAGAMGRRKGPGNGNKPCVVKDQGCCRHSCACACKQPCAGGWRALMRQWQFAAIHSLQEGQQTRTMFAHAAPRACKLGVPVVSTLAVDCRSMAGCYIS